jgi:hypothetical protein
MTEGASKVRFSLGPTLNRFVASRCSASLMSAGNISYMNLQMDKLSATGLVRAYRRRELSPVEVTRAVLQRIERLNPHYNAFCVVGADKALRSAMQSEARWQKKSP